MLVSIDSRLRKRWEQAYRQEAAPDAWDLLVWILDSEDALESVSADPEAMECWSRITGTYRRLHVCTVIACVENAPVSFGAPELLRELRERRCCLFFDDLQPNIEAAEKLGFETFHVTSKETLIRKLDSLLAE